MSGRDLGGFGDRRNLLFRQGAAFKIYGTLNNPDGSPVNLTACGIRGAVRKTRLSVGDPVLALVAVIATPLTGQYEIDFSSLQTRAIDAGEEPGDSASRYVWELELVDSLGRPTPICYGEVVVQHRITPIP